MNNERHYAGIDIPLVECINPRIGKWLVRWDVRPHEEERPEGEAQNDTVSFIQRIFPYKPTMEQVVRVMIESTVYPSMQEAGAINTLLDNSLEAMKEMLLAVVGRYDKSEAVNSFTLSGKQMWLDKETRVGLVNSINIEKAAGKEVTSLWFGGAPYTIPVDTALEMLAAVEMYATETYNVTQAHIAAVNLLDDIEQVLEYDYRVGYPEKLVFNLNNE